MSELLRMEHISKRFGNFYANQDINFSVAKGEVHTLLGENGAGKSTLIKTILQQVNIGQAGYERKNVQQINTQQLCKIACDRRRNPNSFNACRGTVKL